MDIYDGIGLLTLNLESSVGESGNPLHSHLLLNCVHKYTDTYDGKDMLTLYWKVVSERVEPIPYLSPSKECSQIYRQLCWYRLVGPYWEVLFVSVVSTPCPYLYPSQLCSPIHRHL